MSSGTRVAKPPEHIAPIRKYSRSYAHARKNAQDSFGGAKLTPHGTAAYQDLTSSRFLSVRRPLLPHPSRKKPSPWQTPNFKHEGERILRSLLQSASLLVPPLVD